MADKIILAEISVRATQATPTIFPTLSIKIKSGNGSMQTFNDSCQDFESWIIYST